MNVKPTGENDHKFQSGIHVDGTRFGMSRPWYNQSRFQVRCNKLAKLNLSAADTKPPHRWLAGRELDLKLTCVTSKWIWHVWCACSIFIYNLQERSWEKRRERERERPWRGEAVPLLTVFINQVRVVFFNSIGAFWMWGSSSAYVTHVTAVVRRQWY